MRIFIAIDLEENIKKELSLLIEKLKRVSKNVKWVKKEGMHLTLKFLGEVAEDNIPKIESLLRKTSERHNSFPLHLLGIGTFPPGKKNPRVLWVGIEENKRLEAFQAQIEEGLAKLGFPKEKREYHPHLTLGRIKIHSYLGEALFQLEKNKEKSFGEMLVRKITFFQSILKPTGAKYKVLSEFKLK